MKSKIAVGLKSLSECSTIARTGQGVSLDDDKSRELT
jgi:hypothetical protein